MTETQRAGGESPPLVSMQGITKQFPGVTANDSVDLTINSGEVHALIGENGAGKSTLMRVLYGLYPPEEGRILVNGEEVRVGSPRVALSLGIGMVHQHFVLVDRFTVVENIVLGAEGSMIVDYDAAAKSVEELARSYGFSVDPRRRIEDLSVGEQQRVEIVKALYRGIELLILDEPTAVLTPSETTELFQNLRKLKDSGKSIVFISHKLDEVLAIADRITVLRQGKVVGETTPSETSKRQLAEMMVGRPILFRLDKPQGELGEPVLDIKDLTVGTKVTGLDLQIRSGEIVGIAGVEGNGQLELAEAVIGLRPIDAGSVTIDGKSIVGKTVSEIRELGVAYVPEDRHDRGLVLNMSLWENCVLGRHHDPKFTGRLMLVIRRIREMALRLIKAFDVRARSIAVEASTLSGGNQQKLILARELDGDPRLLIAHQPTRGLDVGAIEFVWGQILEQKDEGRAVLLISAELDEIFALSDRIVTLYEGRKTGEYPPDAAPEDVGIGMTGGEREEKSA